MRGQISTIKNYLLPNVTAAAQSNAQEINLAAMGFKPAALAAFGFAPGSFSTIVKVNTTSAQLNVDQILFNLPDYYLYKAAQKAADATALGVAEWAWQRDAFGWNSVPAGAGRCGADYRCGCAAEGG